MLESPRRELIAVIEPGGGYALDWQYSDSGLPRAAEEWQENFYNEYTADADYAWWDLGTAKIDHELSQSVRYLRKVAASFIRELVRTPGLELLRGLAPFTLPEEDGRRLIEEAPYLTGGGYLDRDWLERAGERLHRAYAADMAGHHGSIGEYFQSKNPDIHIAGRVYFHLVESRRDDYPFAFLATYAAEARPEGKARHLPLKNALLEYGRNSRKLLELLSTVKNTAGKSRFIAELLESGEIFHPIGLNADEAYTFLKETPIYEEAGILCRIPNWWRKKSESIKVSISIGSKKASLVGLEALVDYDVHLSLGGEELAAEEAKRLLAESEGLAFIKGKWVEVDRERLRQTLEAYERACGISPNGFLTMMEAMRMQLSPSRYLPVEEDGGAVEVGHGEWLESLLSGLRQPRAMAGVNGGEDFNAVLRDYQRKGLSWLYTMRKLGLGACLADDMGLGKTVQVLALLNSLRSDHEETVLLVVPASLIGNWTAEITRFAPGLHYRLIHPQEKNRSWSAENIESGIYITTYGMLARTAWLKEVRWDIVILDEAQAIKNPATKQTKSAKQLQAGCRIALTGTPVENKLADLWSLFDFLNRGLLGNIREFSGFAKKLEKSGAGYSRLKQVVSPFILRRLKSDKNVVADLPEKIEMKSYAHLGKKQAVLYMALVRELRKKLENSEGIERKGLVLAALVKFKQICNHPDQYLGQDAYLAGESGKFDRLREICETIYARRERVLVFTQFREITAPLAAFLQTVFHRPGLVLHGQTRVAKRQEIVDKFQGPEYVPFLVLSIKAGGVGLNLTAANHVIHFDRWWNPAVENQATDRAFRIGQKKNVLVHKFITRGTIEEKIDLMIEEKIKLSRDIVPDLNESWITEMDNRQLLDLFRLTI